MIVGICLMLAIAIVGGYVSIPVKASESTTLRPTLFSQESCGKIILDEGGMSFYAEDITYLQSLISSLFDEIDDYTNNKN